MIRIEDQNKYSGPGKPPASVKASRTSSTFAHAWDVARGSASSGIANFRGTNDASDAGSHHFATDAPALDAKWGIRNNDLSGSASQPGNIGGAVFYNRYSTAQMNADMN